MPTANELATAAIRAGWSRDQAAIAVAISLAESGGAFTNNCTEGEQATGGTECCSVGPWQINYCPSRDGGSIRDQAAHSGDLMVHARAAKAVYDGAGWNQWTQYTNGTFSQYLAQAQGAVSNPAPRLPDPIAPPPLVTGTAGSGGGGGIVPVGLDLNPFDNIKNAIDKILKFLSEGALRIGEAVGGATLIAFGLFLLFADTKAGKQVVSKASKYAGAPLSAAGKAKAAAESAAKSAT